MLKTLLVAAELHRVVMPTVTTPQVAATMPMVFAGRASQDTSTAPRVSARLNNHAVHNVSPVSVTFCMELVQNVYLAMSQALLEPAKKHKTAAHYVPQPVVLATF